MKFFRRASKKTWSIVAAVAVIGLAGSYVVAKKYLRPMVKEWRGNHFNEEAREFLAKKDPVNAMVLARKGLQSQRDNPETWRIAAVAAKQLDRPEAIFYQDNLCKLAPTKENYLELIRLAQRFNQDAFALQAVTRASKLAVNEPEFYELAAKAYFKVGRPLGAKYFLVSLTTLRPTDTSAQLDLAEIEMSEDPERKDKALRARVRALAEIPELRQRAVTLLLRESVDAKLKVESAELASRLRAIPNLGVADQILLIRASMVTQSEDRSSELLETLQKDVATKPADVGLVIEFMDSQGWGDRIDAWYSKLPKETRADEEVRHAFAEALYKLNSWDRMRVVLSEGNWPKREWLRRALLAYSYRQERRIAEFEDTWRGAVVEAGSNVRDAAALLSRVDGWRWERERYDVLWKLFSLVPDNALVRQQLLAWERRQGNTANLNRLFARVLDIDPKDTSARNNFAYTSLLLDANLSRAGLISQELISAEPDNPYFVSTRAFALYKQEKYSDALQLLETLRESALAVPERVLLHSLFLSRTGNYARAAERISNLVRPGLLPEEAKLAASVDQDIARHLKSEDRFTQLQLLRQSQTGEAVSASWIDLLRPEVRKSATVDMQLADSLYSSKDYTALQQLLRDGQWGDDDYLRSGLLVFAARNLGDNAGALDAWRQALRLAERNTARLDNLLRLTAQWNWPAERIDVLNRMHALDPSDRLRMDELLSYYRQARRTPDLVRVLRPWVDRFPDHSPETVAYTYYCLLGNVNTTDATVRAKSAFEAEPDNNDRRLVYALSLWRQNRNAEAGTVLRDVSSGKSSSIIAGALVEAAVDVELERTADAKAKLEQFQPDKALPEEVDLSRKLAARLTPK